jgi:hypothetical protein
MIQPEKIAGQERRYLIAALLASLVEGCLVI